MARPCELVRLNVLPSHVEAEVRGEGATQLVKAQWLIGCDGMHSRVREQAGISFKGGS